MSTIVINSMAELRIFQSKLRSLKNTLPQLRKIAFEKAMNDVLLDRIKTDMSAKDFSDKIIDGTFIGRIQEIDGKLVGHIISDFEADNGFDVANAREEGTRQPNPIRPNNPNGALKIPLPGGGIAFRKLSRPEGMPRLLIIEKNIKQLQMMVLANYQSNIGEAVSKFLGGS